MSEWKILWLLLIKGALLIKLLISIKALNPIPKEDKYKIFDIITDIYDSCGSEWGCERGS